MLNDGRLICEHAASCPTCGEEVVFAIAYRPVAGYPDSWTGPGQAASVDDVSADPVTCDGCGAILTAGNGDLDLERIALADMSDRTSEDRTYWSRNGRRP